MKICALASVLLMSWSLTAYPDIDLGEAVSFYALIGDSEHYDGKRIRIKGRVLALDRLGGSEGSRHIFIFPNRESIQFFNTFEALAARADGPIITQEILFDDLKSWNGEMIEIVGIYENDPQPSGVFGVLAVETYRKAKRPNDVHER